MHQLYALSFHKEFPIFDAMKNLVTSIISIFSVLLVLSATAQKPVYISGIPEKGPTEHPRLIIRADDMGSSHSANTAIRRSYTEGYASCVEVMAVAPWFPEAVRILEEDKDIDVGLHLTITSEWDNIKWKPLSFWHSLVDSNSYFYPVRSTNADYPGQALSEANIDIQELEFELRAQIELALRRIPRISHLTDHMGFTELDNRWLNLVLKLSAEYGLPFDMNQYHLVSLGYNGPSTTYREKKKSFIAMLKSLEPGKNYLFIDHPGIDNAELQAIHHKGYENVASDRQGVTDLFTSRKVKRAIQKLGIEVISYKDLLKK